MAMINKNEYGIIGVNNSVVTKMIINNMLNYEEYLIPCNRKGKPIAKNLLTGFNDFQNSVEITENKGELYITLYIISKFGESMSNTANLLCEEIEKDFQIIGLNKPKEIKIIIKGVMSKQIAERNIELVKVNE